MPEEFLNPTSIIRDHLTIKPGMAAVDFGCGSGGWTIPLAEMMEHGKVYAVDILEEPLSALRSKIASKRIFNVEVMRMDVEKPILRLLNNFIDVVLISNTLFQTREKKRVLEEGKRILKPGGKILVIEWEKDAPGSPKEAVSAEEIRNICDGIGLTMVESFKAGHAHYGLVFTKNQPSAR